MHSYSYLDPGIVLRYLCSRSTLENLGLRIRISQDYPEGFWPEILRVLLLGLSWDILVPIPSLENPDLRIRNSQDYPGINYRIFLRFSGEIQGNLGLFSQGIDLFLWQYTIDMTWKWIQYFFVQLIKGYDACNNKCKFL